MEEPQTASVKYVFLDIVRFSTGRSVEAQAAIVGTLNACVRMALNDAAAPEEQTILIPTGDGICIALLNVEHPYDIHMRIALALLDRLQDHNDQERSDGRRFQVRIGINANTDNVVIDINTRKNVAGAGVNTASRIMSLAGPNQILVGATVFELLNEREKYMGQFRTYEGTVKHQRTLSVHQLFAPSRGLDVGVPPAFAPKRIRIPRLDRVLGHYLLFAIRYRVRLLAEQSDAAGVVWLWCRANDAAESEVRKEHQEPFYRTHGAEALSAEEQLAYYDTQDVSMTIELAGLIAEKYLERYTDCFEEDGYGSPEWRVVSENGKARLAAEHPDLNEQLDGEPAYSR